MVCFYKRQTLALSVQLALLHLSCICYVECISFIMSLMHIVRAGLDHQI